MGSDGRGAIALKAGFTYFALVFGAGFVLGPIRIMVLVPQVGERIAELLELPIMLLVVFWVARWVIRKFQVPSQVGLRLAIGIIAVGLILLLEFTVVLQLRGLTLSQYLQTRDPIAGTAYYLSLGVCALMPWLVKGSSITSQT